MTQNGKPIHRLKEIDALRAVGIIVIMMTHVYSRHLDNAFDYAIWNNLHFVVVGFVFASGYVLARKYPTFTDFKETVGWYKKRILHLLFPYYIYLITHYLLWFLFPGHLSGYDLKMDPKFILESLLLSGGAPLGWIVLLFVQLTLIFPLLMHIMNKKKSLYFFYLIIALMICLAFTIQRYPPENFRRVMWITWSLVFIFGAYMSVKERLSHNGTVRTAFYFKWGTAALITYTAIYILFDWQNIPRQLVDHKYPPNYFYITYGLAATMGMLAFMRITSIHLQLHINKIITFLSKNSYTLYFIHYIVLDFVFKNTDEFSLLNQPLLQSILVISASIICFKSYDILINRQESR